MNFLNKVIDVIVMTIGYATIFLLFFLLFTGYKFHFYGTGLGLGRMWCVY